MLMFILFHARYALLQQRHVFTSFFFSVLIRARRSMMPRHADADTATADFAVERRRRRYRCCLIRCEYTQDILIRAHPPCPLPASTSHFYMSPSLNH